MSEPIFPTPDSGRPAPLRQRPVPRPQPASPPRPAISALSIISLITGALSPLLVCPCYLSLLTAPVAIVTGHIAHYRIRRSAGRLTGQGLSIAGLALGYLSLLLTAGLFAFGAYWSGRSGNEPAADIPRQPGESELLNVESQIISDSDGYALGNSEEARDLARAFADRMKELDETLFTQTDATIKLSGGEYVTWCERRDGRCAFVVHVPEYRRFDDEAKDILAQLAWITAQQTAADSLEPGEKLAVGLKGILLYGAVIVGEYDPDYDGEDVRVHDDKDLLYPYFIADASPPADPHDPPAAVTPQDAGNLPADDATAVLPQEPRNSQAPPAPDAMPAPAPQHPEPVADSPQAPPAVPNDDAPSADPPASAPQRPTPPRTPRRNSNPESVADALLLLEEDESFLRTQAVYYFRDHPPSEDDARPAVVDALFAQFEVEGDAAPNAFFVATALRPWVTNDDVERLDGLLEHDNVLVRTHVIETIGLLGTTEAAEVLAARLGDPDQRIPVSYPLRQMGDVAEDPLLAQLRELDDDPQAVQEICTILGDVGGTKSVRPLQRLSQSRNLTIKSLAQSSLDKVRQRLRARD